MNTGPSTMLGWGSLAVAVLGGAYLGYRKFDSGYQSRTLDQGGRKARQQREFEEQLRRHQAERQARLSLAAAGALERAKPRVPKTLRQVSFTELREELERRGV